MENKWIQRALILLVFMGVIFFAFCATAKNVAQDLTNNFVRFSDNGDGCWFCALYKTIFCAGNAMAVAIFNSLAESCFKLGAIIMALWVCWMVFKLFLGFSSDASTFFANFFKASLVFIACCFMLLPRYGGGPKFIFDIFMNPLLETSADLSVSIMYVGTEGAKGGSVPDLSGGSNYNPAKAVLDQMSDKPYGGEINDIKEENATCPSSKEGGFSDKALLKLLRMIQAINLKLIQVMIAGKAMWKAGFGEKSLSINIDYLIPGLVLMATGLYLLITAMFKFVDAIVRMLFSCALTPLYIMFWIFPITRKYTVAAIKMFVTSLCFFIVTATLLTFAIILVGGDKITSSMHDLYDNNSYASMTSNFSMANGGFLLTVAVSIIAGGLLDMADPLAKSFGGAESGGGAGAALRGAAGRAAGGAASLAGGVAKKGAAVAGNAAKKVVGGGYRKLKKVVLSRGAGGSKSFDGGGKKDA